MRERPPAIQAQICTKPMIPKALVYVKTDFLLALSQPDFFGPRIPGKFLREDFARRIGVDEGFDAATGTRVARVGEGAQGDAIAGGGFLDCGFGEASDLQEALGGDGVASGVERGGWFGLVRGDGALGIEFGSGADVDCDFV